MQSDQLAADVQELEDLERTMIAAQAALEGPARDVIARRVPAGPECRISVTTMEHLSRHLEHVIAALGEVRTRLEQPPVEPPRRRRR